MKLPFQPWPKCSPFPIEGRVSNSSKVSIVNFSKTFERRMTTETPRQNKKKLSGYYLKKKTKKHKKKMNLEQVNCSRIPKRLGFILEIDVTVGLYNDGVRKASKLVAIALINQ